MRFATSVVFALLTLSGVSLASPYSKACNKGPEYWCANFRNADKCGAVGHCLQTVWTKQKYQVDQDLVAIKFTRLFEQLKQRRGGYSDEEVQSMLDSTCRSIPHVAAGLRCKELLSDRAVELRALLSSDLPAGALCSVMSLCNDVKMDHLLSTPKHKKPENKNHKKKLIGAEKCTWGPSYWCANISNSHDCGAIRHCVERVWSRTAVPEDHDSVCQICLDMVKQARDQLQSNETQEELKQVFEGSCNLIPIKVVATECRRLADDFVPELVETLSSEMNPTQVCSVAGLCNNVRIDKLLESYQEQEKSQKECSGCHHVVGLIRTNFNNTKYEDFLVNLLKMCRKAGSFSDSCSMLVFAHYEELISALQHHLVPRTVCHLSGQCVGAFHLQPGVHLSTAGDSGFIAHDKDELPCELCEQLVKHLRDVLITKTTETEFFTVLKGICKQTGNFKDECLSLVEQWYPVIYNYLQSELKPKELCALANICTDTVSNQNVPIAPLLTSELMVKAITPSSKLIGQDEAHSYKRIKVPSQSSSVRVLGREPSYALPVDRMFPALPSNKFQNKQGCVLCQYILHFVQVEISDSKNEDKIKAAVEQACDRLPESFSNECDQFVEAYGPAVIALLVQEIDPSSVCPALNICPKTSEVMKVSPHAGQSSCPLCLFAVEQLETVLKDNKTEAHIRSALEGLCRSLSENLKLQCVEFVDQYTEELVEMLVADLDAQEICVYLKICKDKTADPLHLKQSAIDEFMARPYLRGDENRMRKRPHAGDAHAMIQTNEIPDPTYNGKPKVGDKTTCVICEFVMKEIDSELKNKKGNIEKVVHSICNVMPKSVSKECNDFVNQYADIVISLLEQELDPDEVCREIKICPDTDRKLFKDQVLDCAVCETVAWAVEKVLANPELDHRVARVMDKACGMLPAKYHNRCVTLMEIYGDSIVSIIAQYGAKDACRKIMLCGDMESVYLNLQKQ